MAAILLGLLRDGEPVAGLTWLPFTGERYTAVVGEPLYANGVAQPPLKPPTLADSIVGIGTFNVDSRGRVPGPLPARGAREPEPRSARGCGCTAPPASTWRTPRPECSAAQSVSVDHVWDHAAGVALVRAAGGIVTDLAGSDWTTRRARRWPRAPGVHGEILDIVNSVGDPEDY